MYDVRQRTFLHEHMCLLSRLSSFANSEMSVAYFVLSSVHASNGSVCSRAVLSRMGEVHRLILKREINSFWSYACTAQDSHATKLEQVLVAPQLETSRVLQGFQADQPLYLSAMEQRPLVGPRHSMSSKARLQPRQLEATLVVGPTALKPDPGRLELEKPEAMKGNSSSQQEKQL